LHHRSAFSTTDQHQQPHQAPKTPLGNSLHNASSPGAATAASASPPASSSPAYAVIGYPASWLAGSLTKLSLEGCAALTSAGLRLVVTSFPALSSLDLSSTACDDTVLALMTARALPQLRELHVKRCPVSVAATCEMLHRMSGTLSVLSASPFVAAAVAPRAREVPRRRC
jgi:hypothetical protein